MSEIQMKNIRTGVSWGNGVKILVSVILAGAFSIFCLLLLAVLMTATDLSEMTTGWMVGLVTYGSIFLAGFLSGWGAQRRGWLFGAIAGICYLILLRLIGRICMGSGSMITVFSALLPAVLVGAVGGIVGINLGRRKRR